MPPDVGGGVGVGVGGVDGCGGTGSVVDGGVGGAPGVGSPRGVAGGAGGVVVRGVDDDGLAGVAGGTFESGAVPGGHGAFTADAPCALGVVGAPGVADPGAAVPALAVLEPVELGDVVEFGDDELALGTAAGVFVPGMFRGVWLLFGFAEFSGVATVPLPVIGAVFCDKGTHGNVAGGVCDGDVGGAVGDGDGVCAGDGGVGVCATGRDADSTAAVTAMAPAVMKRLMFTFRPPPNSSFVGGGTASRVPRSGKLRVAAFAVRMRIATRRRDALRSD